MSTSPEGYSPESDSRVVLPSPEAVEAERLQLLATQALDVLGKARTDGGTRTELMEGLLAKAQAVTAYAGATPIHVNGRNIVQFFDLAALEAMRKDPHAQPVEPLLVEEMRRESPLNLRDALVVGATKLLQQRTLVDPTVPPKPAHAPDFSPALAGAGVSPTKQEDEIDLTATTAFVAAGGSINRPEDNTMQFVGSEGSPLVHVMERTPETLAALKAAIGIVSVELAQQQQATPEA